MTTATEQSKPPDLFQEYVDGCAHALVYRATDVGIWDALLMIDRNVQTDISGEEGTMETVAHGACMKGKRIAFYKKAEASERYFQLLIEDMVPGASPWFFDCWSEKPELYLNPGTQPLLTVQPLKTK